MVEVLVLASIAGVAVATASVPQDISQTNSPADIVVTGERVPRSLQETASSVVVVTAREIEAQAGDRVEQLLAMIPNMQLGSGVDGPAIRGQDSTGVVRELFAFLGGTRPRATLTIDGRAVTYNEYVNGVASIWDVERLEVFRSPQTTTQGRNSIAGAIFVNTIDPTYNWEGRARAIVGDFRTRRASAVLSGPIVDDQFAVRVAGDLKLGRTSSDMADGIPGANIERDDHRMVRVKFLAEPRGLPGARFEAVYSHVETQAPQFEAVSFPFKQRRFPLPERTNGVMRTNVDSVTASLSYQFAPALTSRTTLTHGKALMRRFGLPGLGRTRSDSSDYSAESILSWQPPGGPMELLGGMHYLTMKQDQFIDITGLRIGSGGFDDSQGSLGVFGEARWRPRPRLVVTTGLRYQRDNQDREGQVGPVGRGITIDYDEEFEAWLPKVSVAYDLTDSATIGFLAQRAFNPGGTTVNLATRRQDDFGAEQLWNYEAFVRGSFARSRGTFAANLFYNDVKDAQRAQTIEFIAPDGLPFRTTQIANAPSAKSYGAELELAWRASSRLSLRLGLGLLGTEIRRTLSLADPIRGKAFQRSPNVSAAAAIDWQPIDDLRLSAQLRTASSYFSDDANTRGRRVKGSTTVNARAAYTTGTVTVSGYVRNALNALNLTYLFTPTFGTAGDPREFGVGVEKSF